MSDIILSKLVTKLYHIQVKRDISKVESSLGRNLPSGESPYNCPFCNFPIMYHSSSSSSSCSQFNSSPPHISKVIRLLRIFRSQLYSLFNNIQYIFRSLYNCRRYSKWYRGILSFQRPPTYYCQNCNNYFCIGSPKEYSKLLQYKGILFSDPFDYLRRS